MLLIREVVQQGAQNLSLCQVFALSTLGDHIYFRTDVTPDELVGRTWKVVHMNRPALITCSQATSMDTLSSVDGSSSGSSQANESMACYRCLLIRETMKRLRNIESSAYFVNYSFVHVTH